MISHCHAGAALGAVSDAGRNMLMYCHARSHYTAVNTPAGM